MDGFKATRKIRQFEKLHDLDPVPIIALTGNALLANKVKCLEAGSYPLTPGMTDFLSKPVTRATLSKLLEKVGRFMTPVHHPAPAAHSRRYREPVEPVKLARRPLADDRDSQRVERGYPAEGSAFINILFASGPSTAVRLTPRSRTSGTCVAAWSGCPSPPSFACVVCPGPDAPPPPLLPEISKVDHL